MKQIIAALCGRLQERIAGENDARVKKLMPLFKACRDHNRRLEKRIDELEKKLLTELAGHPPRRTRKRRLKIEAGDIVSIRERLGLSQGAFADLLEIDRACLNRWEHGKITPSQKSMAKIAPFRSMGVKELKKRLQKHEDAVWND